MDSEKSIMKFINLFMVIIFLAAGTLNAKIIYVSATNGQTGANGTQLTGIFPDSPVPTFTEAFDLVTNGDTLVVTGDDYLASKETFGGPETILYINKDLTFMAHWLSTNPTKLAAVLKFGIRLGGADVSFESWDNKAYFILEHSYEYIHLLYLEGTLNIGTYSPDPSSKHANLNEITPALHINAGEDDNDLHFYFDGDSKVTGNPPTIEHFYNIFYEWEGPGNTVSDKSTEIINDGTAGYLGMGAIVINKDPGTSVTIDDPLSFWLLSYGFDFPWIGEHGGMPPGVAIITYSDVQFASLFMATNDILNVSYDAVVTIGVPSAKTPAINSADSLVFLGFDIAEFISIIDMHPFTSYYNKIPDFNRVMGKSAELNHEEFLFFFMSMGQLLAITADSIGYYENIINGSDNSYPLGTGGYVVNANTKWMIDNLVPVRRTMSIPETIVHPDPDTTAVVLLFGLSRGVIVNVGFGTFLFNGTVDIMPIDNDGDIPPVTFILNLGTLTYRENFHTFNPERDGIVLLIVLNFNTINFDKDFMLPFLFFNGLPMVNFISPDISTYIDKLNMISSSDQRIPKMNTPTHLLDRINIPEYEFSEINTLIDNLDKMPVLESMLQESEFIINPTLNLNGQSLILFLFNTLLYFDYSSTNNLNINSTEPTSTININGQSLIGFLFNMPLYIGDLQRNKLNINSTEPTCTININEQSLIFFIINVPLFFDDMQLEKLNINSTGPTCTINVNQPEGELYNFLLYNGSNVNFYSGPNLILGALFNINDLYSFILSLDLDRAKVSTFYVPQATVRFGSGDTVMVGNYIIGDGSGDGGTAIFEDGSVVGLMDNFEPPPWDELDLPWDGNFDLLWGESNPLWSGFHRTWGGTVIMGLNATGTFVALGDSVSCDGGNLPGIKLDGNTFNINDHPANILGPVVISSTLNLNVNTTIGHDMTIGDGDSTDIAVLNLNTTGCTTLNNSTIGNTFTLNSDGTVNVDPNSDGTSTTITVYNYTQYGPSLDSAKGMNLEQNDGCTFNVWGDFNRYDGNFVHDGSSSFSTFNISGPYNQYFNPGSGLELYSLNLIKSSKAYVVTFGSSTLIGSVDSAYSGTCYIGGGTKINLDVYNINMQYNSSIVNYTGEFIVADSITGAVASIHGDTRISGPGYYGNLLTDGGNFLVGGWILAPPWDASNVYFMGDCKLFNGGVLVDGKDFGPYSPPAPAVEKWVAVDSETPATPEDPRVIRYITDGTDPIDVGVTDGVLDGNEIELVYGGKWNFADPHPYDLLITGTATVTTTAGPELQPSDSGDYPYLNDIDIYYLPFTGVEQYLITNTSGGDVWYQFNGVLDVKDTSKVNVDETASGETYLASIATETYHTIHGTILGDGVFGVFELEGEPNTITEVSGGPWPPAGGRLEIDESVSKVSNMISWIRFRHIRHLRILEGSGDVVIHDIIFGIDTLIIDDGNVSYRNWKTEYMDVNGGTVALRSIPLSWASPIKGGSINVIPAATMGYIQEFNQDGGTVELIDNINVEEFIFNNGIFNFTSYDVNMWDATNSGDSKFLANNNPGAEFMGTTGALNWPDSQSVNWWGTNGLLVPNAVVNPNVSVILASNSGVGSNTSLSITDPSSTLWLNGYQLEINGTSGEWRTHDVYRSVHWDAGYSAPDSGSDSRIKVSGSGVILYSYDTDFILSSLNDNGIDLEVAMNSEFEILDTPAEEAWIPPTRVKNSRISGAYPDSVTILQTYDFIMTSGTCKQNDNDIYVGNNFIFNGGDFNQDEGNKDYTGLDKDYGELVFAPPGTHLIEVHNTDLAVPNVRIQKNAGTLEIQPNTAISKVGEIAQTYYPLIIGKRLILGQGASQMNTYGMLSIADSAYIERRVTNGGINGAVNWLGIADVGIIATDDVNNSNANPTLAMNSTNELPDATTDASALHNFTLYYEGGGSTNPLDYDLDRPIQVNNQLLLLGGDLDPTAVNTVTMASTVIINYHSDETSPAIPRIGPDTGDLVQGGPVELIYRGQVEDLTTRSNEWAVDVNTLRVEMGYDGSVSTDGTPNLPAEDHILSTHADLTVQHKVYIQNRTSASYLDLNGNNLTALGAVTAEKSEDKTITAAGNTIQIDAPGGVLNADFECDSPPVPGTGDYVDESTIFSPNGPVGGNGFIYNIDLGSPGSPVHSTNLSGTFRFTNEDEFGTAGAPPFNADPDECWGRCLTAYVTGPPANFGSFEGTLITGSSVTINGNFTCGDITAGGIVVETGKSSGDPCGTVDINGAGPHIAGTITAPCGGGWNGTLNAVLWTSTNGPVTGEDWGSGTLWIGSGHCHLQNVNTGIIQIDNGNLIVSGYMAGMVLLGNGPFDPVLHVGESIINPDNPVPDAVTNTYLPPDSSTLFSQVEGPWYFVTDSLEGTSYVYGWTYVMDYFCGTTYAFGHLILNNMAARMLQCLTLRGLEDFPVIDNSCPSLSTIHAWADVIHNDYDHGGDAPDPCEYMCSSPTASGLSLNFWGWNKQTYYSFYNHYANSISISKRNQQSASPANPNPDDTPNLGSESLIPEMSGLVEFAKPGTLPTVPALKAGSNELNADFDEEMSPDGWTLITKTMNLTDGIIATNNNIIQLPFNMLT
ncbi:hypothetical protein ACFLS9_08320, partial [Bacteroidota bacterium]